MSVEAEDMEFSFLNEDETKLPVSVEEDKSAEDVKSEKEEVEPEVKKEEPKEKPKKKYDPNCTNFRLDPAGEFGSCIHCGRKKADHVDKGQNKAAAMLQSLKAKNSTAGEDEEISKGDGPCSNFRLDPAAAFGTCKCGYKRAEHVEKKKNNAALALERLRSSNAQDWMGSNHKLSAEECTTFKLDTEATEFGVCVFCGRKKQDHGEKKENVAKTLLDNLRKKNEEKHKLEDLKAEGIDVTPEETEDAVAELNNEETKAEEPVPVADAKKGGCCVIS